MSRYLFVQKINDRQEIVLDSSTRLLCRRKYLTIFDESVYQYLLTHHHPNINQVIDFYYEDNKLTVIEPEIQGQSLRTHLDQNDLSPKEKEFIFDEILDGVQFLHNAVPPIIHRDLKAENIMITTHKVVKIIDFNAAKTCHSHKSRDTVLIGTEGSAAPEQYGFGESDKRTDIYALGKLAAEMFPDKKYLIQKATAIDPGSRFQSIEEMRRAFHSALTPWSYIPFSINSPKTVMRFLLLQLLFLLIALTASSLISDRICILAIFEALYMLYAKWTPLFKIMSAFDSQKLWIRILIYSFVTFGIIFLGVSVAVFIK